jgi:hypothetical protein
VAASAARTVLPVRQNAAVRGDVRIDRAAGRVDRCGTLG